MIFFLLTFFSDRLLNSENTLFFFCKSEEEKVVKITAYISADSLPDRHVTTANFASSKLNQFYIYVYCKTYYLTTDVFTRNCVLFTWF